MINIIDAIELTNGILHADIIDSPSGPFVIEMSARPSGHYLHNVFTPAVTGINMIELFLTYAQGQEIHIQPKDYTGMKYLIHYFDISDAYVRHIPEEKYLYKKYPLEQYVCNMKVGKTNTIEDGHSIMNRGYYILKGNSESELAQYSQAIIKEFL